MLDIFFTKLFEFIGLFKFWRVIPINKVGVRIRWGKNPIELKPGLHFIWPFEIDNVKTVIIKSEWLSTIAIHITTKDLKTATFGATLEYHITEPIKWLYEANDAATNLNDIVRFCTSDILTECDWVECTKKPIWTKIKNKIKDNASHLGIAIDDYGLIDLALSKLVITQV
jgi:regulator of protease activity HflC (stomatin/prohibitin superfamily)